MHRLVSILRSRPLLVTLAFSIVPNAYGQPARQASTSLSNGAVSVSAPGKPAYHPTHTLVRFRPGAAPVFLPGSGTTIPFPTLPGLFLVINPPGVSVDVAVA